MIASHLKLAKTEAGAGKSDEVLAAQIGRDFAHACAENLTRQQLSALLTDYPRILRRA